MNSAHSPGPDASIRSMPTATPLAGVSATLRRRWRTLLATMILVVGASILVDVHERKLYRAVAVVYLNPIDLASQVSGAQLPATDSLSLARQAQTQASIAASPQIASAALKLARLRSMSIQSLAAETAITPQSDADLLNFAVTDPLPARAIRLSDAYASAYAQALVQIDTAPLQLAIAKLSARIATLNSSDGSSGSLYSSLVAKETQLDSLIYLESSNATVVSRPIRAPKVRPNLSLNSVLALLVGLVLGAMLMWLREQIDDRVRTEDELCDLLGLPVLGRLSPPLRKASRQLVTVIDPLGAHAEEFRLLRTNLHLAALPLGDPRVFMITSAQPTEGKSTTVANLAVTLAHLGRTVLVMDLDLRRPAQASLMGVRTAQGLTDVLSGRLGFEDAVTRLAVTNKPAGSDDVSQLQPPPPVTLLGTGPLPFNVGDFLALESVTQLIREVAQSGDFDYVLLDTPPIAQFADAQSVMHAVDAMVVVGRLDALTRPAARELRRILSVADTPTLGVVVTGSHDGVAQTAYRYYGYSRQQPDAPPAPGIRDGRTVSKQRAQT